MIAEAWRVAMIHRFAERLVGRRDSSSANRSPVGPAPTISTGTQREGGARFSPCVHLAASFTRSIASLSDARRMKSVDILLDVGRVLFGMVALDNGAAAGAAHYFFHFTAGLRPRLTQMSPLRGCSISNAMVCSTVESTSTGSLSRTLERQTPYSTSCFAVYPSRATIVYLMSLFFSSLMSSGLSSGPTSSTFSLR